MFSRAVGNPGPDVLYVEQAQATLQHIKDIGVLAVADKWWVPVWKIPTKVIDYYITIINDAYYIVLSLRYYVQTCSCTHIHTHKHS